MGWYIKLTKYELINQVGPVNYKLTFLDLSYEWKINPRSSLSWHMLSNNIFLN